MTGHKKNRYFQRWGIIGDGQLARMLALEAYTLGLRPVLLTNDPSSPAAQVCPLQTRGSVHSVTDLHALLSQVDFAVIESEFVNCDALERTGLSSKIIPNIECIRVLQNKHEQKKLLKKLSIPTSPFLDPTEVKREDFFDRLQDKSKPLVLKFATLGYDGKGVSILAGVSDDKEKARAFIELADDRKIDVYAEDKVDFLYEVAMVSVRSKSADLKHYPLVVSEQSKGICNVVKGPATELGCPALLQKQAEAWSKSIADHLDLVGCFAIEFFVTKDQDLIVNEIAPRVHNSGHFTQDFSHTSQFLNHWLAVTGSELGSTASHGLFAMQNILGPDSFYSKEELPPPESSPFARLHWYKKGGVSPGRKLGHVNTGARDMASLEKRLEELKHSVSSWQYHIKASIPSPPMELLK
jgi:5-(carboxyamino)imidazole ribonucleotide synthase